MQMASGRIRAACMGRLPTVAAGFRRSWPQPAAPFRAPAHSTASLGSSRFVSRCQASPWMQQHIDKRLPTTHFGGPRCPQPVRSVTTAAAAAKGRKKRIGRLKTAPGPAPLDITPDRPVVLLGIDPDAGGAIAVVQWAVDTPRTPEGFPVSLLDSSISVHDMPMETIAVSKRNRRQADAISISALLHELLPTLAAKAAVRVVLEQPVPNALNGKFSWFQSGYAYGVWNGVLATYGMPMQVISAVRWKRDMQLYGKGKEGSRQLALALYPHAADAIKRKKDHGRAEALLLAAWGSGIELPEEAFAAAMAALEPAAGAPTRVDAPEPDDAAVHDEPLLEAAAAESAVPVPS